MPQTDLSQPLYLTTREVADLLRVKERKVYDLAAADEIPHRRITGKLLFPAHEIQAWIEGSGTLASPERPAVITGSHDPLLDWAIRDSGCGLATLFNGSRDGLDRYKDGGAVLTGLHIPDEDGWNVKAVSGLELSNSVLISFSKRSRGLLVSDEHKSTISSIGDLRGKRIAMRQPGAGAGVLFVDLVKKAGLTVDDLEPVAGFAHTESEAAAMVAAGDADAALGVQAMAKQYKLTFVPLLEERFDLLADRKAYFSDPVQSLLTFTRSKEFLSKAEAMGGYDISTMGTVRWVSP